MKERQSDKKKFCTYTNQPRLGEKGDRDAFLNCTSHKKL